MVFQGAMHSLNPVIRVGDQVGERLVADGVSKRDARARTADLLTRVGLPAATASRYPHELSGGMKQRVMIATALTHDPPLLILDEPTSALDVSIQAQIMNLLKDLRDERGMCMLFITHDLALASDLCDRIAVVYAGPDPGDRLRGRRPAPPPGPLHPAPPREHPAAPRAAGPGLPAGRAARPARPAAGLPVRRTLPRRVRALRPADHRPCSSPVPASSRAAGCTPMRRSWRLSRPAR